MALDVTTAPTFEPVTLSEAKEAMNLAHGRHDSLITGLIVAARRFVETTLRQTLPTTTYTLYLDRWPSKSRYGESVASHGSILLSMPPAVSVTTVKYIDTDGTQQTFASSKYTLDVKSYPARLALAWSESWPSIRAVVNAIEVEFVAGQAASAIAATLKTGIRAIVQHLYDHPEVAVERSLSLVPMGVMSLIESESHGQLAGMVTI